MIPHALPPLPYDYAALQPWINEPSLRLHHEYHRTGVDALNAAEARLAAEPPGADFAWLRYLQHLVAAQVSEHLLHCLFWEIMGPNQGGTPRDALADQIRDDFGSFTTLKAQFGAAATSPEPGDWVALVWQSGRKRLAVRVLDSHQLPTTSDTGILLALDIGEHAYYSQYHNRRAEYVHNWWNTVKWPRVAERFAVAVSPPSAIGQPPSPRKGTDASAVYASTLSPHTRPRDESRRAR